MSLDDTCLNVKRVRQAMSTTCCLLMIIATLGFFSPVNAQSVDPLVEEGIQIRIEQQEISHLQRTGQISREKAQERSQALQTHTKDFKNRFAQLPKAEQQPLTQQINNRFAVLFPPIQQKWNADALRLQEEDRAQSATRFKEMETDVLATAGMQTERTFRQRQLEQKTISPQEAEAGDAADVAKITALQNKYIGYGGPWVARFNQRVQDLTEQLVQERDRKERLSDTTSNVGMDAHRAAEVSLAMERNLREMRRASVLINYAQEEQENAPLKTELETIQAKYADGGPLAASARDFNERVNNFVLKGTREMNNLQSETEARAYAASRPAKS